jgi:hypothetical protein
MPNGHKLYQMAVKYYKFPFQGPPKFTQIGIFGLNLKHLATLVMGGEIESR